MVDPASNWPLFAEKARELLQKDKVAVVFGCWTSVSRKSVLPVFEELNGLLFYPVQYEGEESSKNVFYTGAAPNQQAIPAVEYLMSKEGGDVKRWVLEGTDYVYPRTTNKILEAFLKSKGVAAEDIMINYTPFGFSDWQTEVAAIKKFGSAGKKTAVVSTINGDANVPFYKELANQGIKASDIPVVAFSVGEEELSGIDTKNLVGHLAAWNYFEVGQEPDQRSLHQAVAHLHQERQAHHQRPDGSHLYRLQDVDAGGGAGRHHRRRAVRQALYGQKVRKLTGGIAAVMNTNHHLSKPVMIGEIKPNGQFNVVWKTKGAIKADAWSRLPAEDKGKVADWTFPWVCGNCNRAPSTRLWSELQVVKTAGAARAGCRARRHLGGIAPWSVFLICFASRSAGAGAAVRIGGARLAELGELVGQLAPTISTPRSPPSNALGADSATSAAVAPCSRRWRTARLYITADQQSSSLPSRTATTSTLRSRRSRRAGAAHGRRLDEGAASTTACAARSMPALGSLTLFSADAAERLDGGAGALKHPLDEPTVALHEGRSAETDSAGQGRRWPGARPAALDGADKGAPRRDRHARTSADPQIRGLLIDQRAARQAIAEIEQRRRRRARLDRPPAAASASGVQTLFVGLSLGSVLVLVAIGLAITFGVMGVINMAHGEMMMLGAYTTYVVQQIFRTCLPPHRFDSYLSSRFPRPFSSPALVGVSWSAASSASSTAGRSRRCSRPSA